MTQVLASLGEVAGDYEAIVFDQWGVLHDGSAPYASAVAAVSALHDRGQVLAVLSNSGRRADQNRARLERLGFAPELFDCVMTSGEALWRAVAAAEVASSCLFPITARDGDAEVWAAGLDLSFVPVEEAKAVLLMGLADDAGAEAFDAALTVALERGLPLICSNPDRTAPRAGGAQAVMPGTIAQTYAERGGSVRYFGKPHEAVFRAVEAALGLTPDKILMVGDALEYDIAGAAAAGWSNVLIRDGLHAKSFAAGDIGTTIAGLARTLGTPRPDYTLDSLR